MMYNCMNCRIRKSSILNDQINYVQQTVLKTKASQVSQANVVTKTIELKDI